MALAEAAVLRHGERSQNALERCLDGLDIGAGDLRSLLARMDIGQQVYVPREQSDAGAGPAAFNILGRPVLIQLTNREVHILQGLSRELSNKAIARELQLSNETVKWYIAKMLPKLGARDRRQAVDRARAFGVLPMSYAKSWPPKTAAGQAPAMAASGHS